MEDPQESISKLARGLLRDQPIIAWELMEAGWTLLQKFVRRQLVYKGFPKYFMEDCGQIVMERVWKYRQTYKGDSEKAFWAWLRRICDNEQKRFLEKEAKHPASLTEAMAGSGAEKGDFDNYLLSKNLNASESRPAVDNVMDMETQTALKDCLSGLSKKHRIVMELMYGVSGLSERAVADVMGCSPSFVHKLKDQALERLRLCLEKKDVQ